jgi:hypothetical protein
MRKESTATTATSIPFRPRPAGRIRIIPARLFAAARHIWRETTDAHERIFARPWEQAGPLRWQTDAGGPKLLGSSLELHENEPDTLRPPH